MSPGSGSPPLESTTVFVEVDRFGPTTTVVSLAALFAALESKLALATVAVFVTFGTAAPAAVTVNVSCGSDAPGSSGGGCVHVTFCPDAEQPQPVPAPDTKPRPAGNVSITVTVLSSRCTPAAFATIRRYVLLAPTVKSPVCVFVNDKSTTGSLVALTTCAVSSTRSPPEENCVVADVWPGDSNVETSNVSTSTP